MNDKFLVLLMDGTYADPVDVSLGEDGKPRHANGVGVAMSDDGEPITLGQASEIPAEAAEAAPAPSESQVEEAKAE